MHELLYNVAAVAVLVFAGIGFGLHGVPLWPAVVLHSVMTIWCVVSLRTKGSLFCVRIFSLYIAGCFHT